MLVTWRHFCKSWSEKHQPFLSPAYHSLPCSISTIFVPAPAGIPIHFLTSNQFLSPSSRNKLLILGSSPLKVWRREGKLHDLSCSLAQFHTQMFETRVSQTHLNLNSKGSRKRNEHLTKKIITSDSNVGLILGCFGVFLFVCLFFKQSRPFAVWHRDPSELEYDIS